MSDVNLAVFEEDKSFELLMVVDNKYRNVVAIREEHLFRVSIRREVYDGVLWSKGWWFFNFMKVIEK